jgi:anthranilate phosphoribosyltransferase
LQIQDHALRDLRAHRHLSEDAAHQLAGWFLSGTANSDDMVSVLQALHEKGETVDELVGFIRAMRAVMAPISLSTSPLIDVCGTGGSLSNRFNTSTCVAMVLGAMGHPVAKHGNRGSKKANGSFDFLDALGVPYELSPSEHQNQLDHYGCTFLFARLHHPAVGHVAAARKQLGARSIFNLIGPFCNPASPSIQVIGAPTSPLADTVLAVGQRLGYDTIAAVSSDIGLDECSTVGQSTIQGVRQGQPFTLTIHPQDHGIHHDIADISVSPNAQAVDNAATLTRIISDGCVDHPIVALIALNAAVIRHIISPDNGIDAGIGMAKASLMQLKLPLRPLAK